MRSSHETGEQRRAVTYFCFSREKGDGQQNCNTLGLCACPCTLRSHWHSSDQGLDQCGRSINASLSCPRTQPSPWSCGERLWLGGDRQEGDKCWEWIFEGCVLYSGCRGWHLESARCRYIRSPMHPSPRGILICCWLLLPLPPRQTLSTDCSADRYPPVISEPFQPEVFLPVLQCYALHCPFCLLFCPGRETSFTHTDELKIRQNSKEDSCPAFLLCLDIQAELQILPSETLSVDLKGLLLPADVLFKNSLVHDN